jgi:hypothetical protein
MTSRNRKNNWLCLSRGCMSLCTRRLGFTSFCTCPCPSSCPCPCACVCACACACVCAGEAKREGRGRRRRGGRQRAWDCLRRRTRCTVDAITPLAQGGVGSWSSDLHLRQPRRHVLVSGLRILLHLHAHVLLHKGRNGAAVGTAKLLRGLGQPNTLILGPLQRPNGSVARGGEEADECL